MAYYFDPKTKMITDATGIDVPTGCILLTFLEYKLCIFLKSDSEAEIIAATKRMAKMIDKANAEKRKNRCICTDLLNFKPDPVVNPDCPMHGRMK